jgi:hypothetical protein
MGPSGAADLRISGPTDGRRRRTCDNDRMRHAVTLLLLALLAACGGPTGSDAGTGMDLPRTGDGDGDTPGDGGGDGSGDSCASRFDLCEADSDCCGSNVCVGASGPGDPGACDALDDPTCENPSTCFSPGDCCSPTTCLAPALGEPGICG